MLRLSGRSVLVSVQGGVRPGASVHAPPGAALAESGVVSPPQHVFWAGGRRAEAVARSIADANAGTVIADTAAGRALTRATRGLPYEGDVVQQWRQLSREFARSAEGDVSTVLRRGGVRPESIWRTDEFGELIRNPKVTGIGYHVINPDGTVVYIGTIVP